jgi:hypothetical protein
MNTAELMIAAAVLLAGGLLLPLSHGLRWTLILLLAGLAVAGLLGGSIQFFASLYQ